jgi:hypothetical protein
MKNASASWSERGTSPSRGMPTFRWGPRVKQHRSIQARAALASGISQQAFKKETDIGVACVIPARVTPTSKIPIEGSGSGDEVRKGCVKRPREVRPCLRLRHGICQMLWARRHGENIRLADGVTEPTFTTL